MRLPFQRYAKGALPQQIYKQRAICNCTLVTQGYGKLRDPETKFVHFSRSDIEKGLPTMLRRGLKRKAAEEASESEMHLRNFQSATRRRESMRIKNAAASNNPGALEKHLKEKIAVEKKMIEGAAKLLLSCRNKGQTLEPAKTLLIARLRSDMLKFELNKLRRGRGSPAAAAQQGKPSHAGISVRAP